MRNFLRAAVDAVRGLARSLGEADERPGARPTIDEWLAPESNWDHPLQEPRPGSGALEGGRSTTKLASLLPGQLFAPLEHSRVHTLFASTQILVCEAVPDHV